MPSGTQRSSEMFAGPGAMFTVVLGQRKWYCDCFTSPTGTKGTLPLPLERRCPDRPDLARERRRDRERVRVRVDVDHLAEAGMGGRAVVALEVVLERDLPVRVDRHTRGGSGTRASTRSRPLRATIAGSSPSVSASGGASGSGLTKRNGPQMSTETGSSEKSAGVEARPHAPSGAPCGASRRARTSTRGTGTAASRGCRSPWRSCSARWRQTLTKPRSMPSRSRVTTIGSGPPASR